MTSTEIADRVRKLTSADSLSAASDPFGTVDKIVDLGNEAVAAIGKVFENPSGTYGTYQLNVLALALEKFADAGNDQARTMLQRIAAGQMRSVVSLGPQGGADIAIRVASDWVKKSAEATPSPPKDAKPGGAAHEVKEGMTYPDVVSLLGEPDFTENIASRKDCVWRKLSPEVLGLYVSFESDVAKGIATFGKTGLTPQGSFHYYFAQDANYKEKLLGIVMDGVPTFPGQPPSAKSKVAAPTTNGKNHKRTPTRKWWQFWK